MMIRDLFATIMPGALIDAPTPLTYLRGYGAKADPVVWLTWGLLAISIIVVIVITVMVLAAVRRKGVSAAGGLMRIPIAHDTNGVTWVAIAVSISTVVLFGSMIWTVVVLAAVNAPHQTPGLTIEITGQQWWWQARYLNDDPSRVLTTANEVHIPTGVPVRFKLISADVIHSFWVPALTGKTELVPGLNNVTWLEADRPGTYAGQCSEFCGAQHAHMGFLIVAQTPANFQAWLAAQLRDAPPPRSQQMASAEQQFVFHCGTCHTVRGTPAGGTVAPDLTHLMSRQMLAANTLRNTPANLASWISDPPAWKPSTKMPALGLSGNEFTAIEAYLQTLQ